MKKRTLTALCMAAAVSWVMTAAAQSTTTGTGSTSQNQKEKDKSSKSMTYTGCLQEGTTPGTFILTNVSTGASENWSGSGTSGTSGTGTGTTGSGSTSGTVSSGAGSGNMTYELVPSKGVELKDHVGHQVQVTGTMKAGKKESSGMSGSGTGTSSSGTSGSGMSGQSGSQGSEMEHRIHVRSLKMIADSCTGGR